MSVTFSPCNGSSSVPLSLTSFDTILLDCMVTAVISVWVFKKILTICEFLCSHFNIEDGRKFTFLAYYALLFQER